MSFFSSLGKHYCSYVGQDDEQLYQSGGVSLSPQDVVLLGHQLAEEMKDRTFLTIQNG